MRTAFFVTIAALAGCSSSIERVQSLRAQAPDWYEARKVEFRGEGYPSIFAVPERSTTYNAVRKLEMSEEETLAALALFESDPRAELPQETAEEIMAWAIEVRRAVEGRLPAPDFMTDAEVEEIKARFNVPRARL